MMMNIEKIVRVRNHDEVIRTLKQGPSFGIHGATFKNSWKILNKGSMRIPCHYFAADEKQRELDDNEFYERLWASVERAIGYSCNREIKDNFLYQLKLSCLPCTLLGVDKSNTGMINGTDDPESSRYGHKYRTFGIGHDFAKDILDVHYLIIPGEEIETINKRLSRFCKNKEAHGKKIYGNMIFGYLIQRELVTRMINKIYNVMKRYGESK